MNATPSTLGARLKQIRGRLTLETFASLMGISKSALSRYERDAQKPDADFLIRLIENYPALSLPWLLTGQDTQTIHLSSVTRTAMTALERDAVVEMARRMIRSLGQDDAVGQAIFDLLCADNDAGLIRLGVHFCLLHPSLLKILETPPEAP
jgi:transcriptional regulator with XRE-family HTH domain